MPTVESVAAMGSTVAQNVLRRAEERRNGTPAGSIRTALVIQGGGTRAITSCGAAAALDHLGLRHAFDAVYAVSSGALNAAYFLSGQSALGISVYLEDIIDSRFLSWWRWPTIMNLDYLFESVVKGSKRHDLAATLAHPTPLHVVTTDSESGEPVWFCSHDAGVDLHLALKASCSVPLASAPVVVNGRVLIDGMLVEPIPLVTVLEQGFTDVLVLHTRDFGYRAKELGLGISLLGRALLSRSAYPRFVGEPRFFNSLTDTLESGIYTDRHHRSVRIGCAFPRDAAKIGRFEQRPRRLADAAYTSWISVMQLFGRLDYMERGAFNHYLSASGVSVPVEP